MLCYVLRGEKVMPKCHNCNQDIVKVYFKCIETREGLIGLDDKGNFEFDEDVKERTIEGKCPKCGAIIIPNLQGPFDPQIEELLRREEA